MPRVFTVGGVNRDLFVRVASAPAAGETVSHAKIAESSGGKGGNQAAAVALLGGDSMLVSCVGRDADGRAVKADLANAGVDVTHVHELSHAPTGKAIVVVDDAGQNRIMVADGANAHLAPEHLDVFDRGGSVLLLQLEAPERTAEAAAQRAHARGLSVVLDPAPAPDALSPGLLKYVDVLSPNETEALKLLGIEGKTEISLDEAPGIADRLRSDLGVKTVVLKLGDKGAYIASDRYHQHVAAPAVSAVDTTAAGDTFTAALAIGISRGWELPDSVAFATHAAALSVTKRGAMESIPTLAEVKQAYPFLPGL